MSDFSRYPEYKFSGADCFGEIPAHWQVLPIKFSLEMPITDGPHSTPTFYPDGIPFISAEAVKNDRLDFDKKRGYISQEDHELFSKKYKPKFGDVYMVKSGATTGAVARVQTHDEFNIWSPLAVLRPHPDKAITDFIFFVLKSKPFFYSVEQSWSYGTQQNIGMGVISNIRMALPPLEEQKTIARFLDFKTAQIDALIAKKKSLLDRLAEQRTALISHAVTKGLDPSVAMKDSGVPWLGKIPAHWDAKRLKFVISEPLKYGANEAAELTDPELPRYIRITDVNDDGSLREETFRSLPEEIADGYLLSDGDILLARSGATVGKSFIYKPSWGVAAYAGYLIRARMSEAVNADFAYLFLQSSCYWQWLSSVFIQATIQNVSAEKYANLVIPVPPVKEQLSIVTHLLARLKRIDAQRERVDLAVERLSEYRSALITNAVTGKIDVRDFAIPQPAEGMTS